MIPKKQTHLRETLQRYLDTKALTLRPSTGQGYRYSVGYFIEYLEVSHGIFSFSRLKRTPHIEGWLQRTLVGRRNRPLSQETRRKRLTQLRCFLRDISAWGWKGAPREDLFRNGDLPSPPKYLPRPLSQETDQTLQSGLRARGGLLELSLLLLRATGMRIGELLNLEVDSLRKSSDHPHQWSLRVPVGKLHSERDIPADPDTAQIFDQIRSLRGVHPALPHPDTGKPTHFLLVLPNGARPLYPRMRLLLFEVERELELKEHVTAHRLRHTFATEMLRNGLSLPVLMKLLGHRTIGMTLRYAQVTQADVHRAYLATVELTKARYKLPELPAPVAPQPGGQSSLADPVSLIDIAAAQTEAFRRDIKDQHTKKKIQRLVERLRRTAEDFKNLAL